MNAKGILFSLGLILLATNLVTGQNRNDKQLSNRVIALTPEEQQSHFKLAPGFVIELVASEADGLVKPIDLSFDDAGNLWTQTAKMYPLDPFSDIQWNDLLELMNDQDKQNNHPAFKHTKDLYQGIAKGEDQILKLSGIYDGNLKVDIWADNLTIPMSVLPYKTGAYIAQGSEIFFLDDKDSDGKADFRTPLFTGFGFTDTHTMSHLLIKGPGKWIHFSHGALNKGVVNSYINPSVSVPFDYSKIGRFSLDGKKIEVITAGLNNIWGFTLKANGQWYGSEANDLGYSIVPLEQGAAFSGIGNEKFRSYQPFFPPIHTFRVGGTGLSGLAFSEDKNGGFPDEWKDVGFLANPITNSINAVRMIRQADGRVISEHLPDLLTSEDDWFRPVNITFGPDGCLYIADWYNKIVSHNEVPTTHPDRDKKSGRIWRIRHVSQKSRKITDFYKIKTIDLPQYLHSDYLWEKRAAWNQISERDLQETRTLIPALRVLSLNDKHDAVARIHALWAMEDFGYYDIEMVSSLLSDKNDEIRRETLRYLTSFSNTLEPFLPAFQKLIKDGNPVVRVQVIHTIEAADSITDSFISILLNSCNVPQGGESLGGAYESQFERYLARKTLEKFAPQLSDYLTNLTPNSIPTENLIWAIQVLPVHERAKNYFKLVPDLADQQWDETTFLQMAAMASEPAISKILEGAFIKDAEKEKYIDYTLKNSETLNYPAFQQLLGNPVSKMLESSNHSNQTKALRTVVKYNLIIPEDLVGKFISTASNETDANLMISALDVIACKNPDYYMTVWANDSYTLNTRLHALQGIARTDFLHAKKIVEGWVENMDEVEKKTLTNVLSRYESGTDLVLDLYFRNKIQNTSFEILTAERIGSVAKQKKQSERLIADVRKAEEVRKKKVGERVSKLKTIAERNNGELKKGEILFQTCLQCHQSKGKGQIIAPPLDGLGFRDTEGLLTAILDPDAAIESGYSVYRIIKKDNSILEGFLVKRDNSGSTLAAMGGGKTYVPVSDIKSQHSVTGKSFMPTGLLDNYSENDISDILTYMKSIK